MVIVLIAIIGFMFVDDPKSDDNETPIEQPPSPLNNYSSSISIASFNIQIFGKTKADNPDVVADLIDIVDNFDIIAIQELRDVTEKTMPYFMVELNARTKNNYQYVVSPRLGRTSSKEQYVFIYDPDYVRYIESDIYPDRDDIYEREPFFARFKADQFDFVLVNIHIKPSDAVREIMYLEEVYDYIEEKYEEEDIIILGDLNADGSYFDEDIFTGIRSDEFIWLIDDEQDTTVASNDYTYDRMIIKNGTVQEYTGDVFVYKFDKKPLISPTPELVSDHYPVFASFYTDVDEDE